jgi:hypothetical protein
MRKALARGDDQLDDFVVLAALTLGGHRLCGVMIARLAEMSLLEV